MRKDPKKLQDARIWHRMALELLVLQDFVSGIASDHEYTAVMPTSIWDKLLRMFYRLMEVRGAADTRYATHCHAAYVERDFFERDTSEKAEQIVKDLRAQIKEAAHGK